jgi:hypothetical protein
VVIFECPKGVPAAVKYAPKPLDIRAFEELVMDLRDGAEHMPSWDRTPQGCVEKRSENPHQEYCASRDNTRNVSVMLEPQFGEHEVHGIAGTGALDNV